MAERIKVAVLGAGVTGLSAALALREKSIDTVVFERSGRIGGSVRTEKVDGFLCEAGPNSMLLKTQEAEDILLQHLGIGADLVDANSAANKRFLVRDGKILPAPMGPADAVRTPLYSFQAKLRVLREPFIEKSRAEDESVASFVRRRLGPEFLHYGISALVSGIFAGDPERISIRHGFPRVWNLEQNYGSLIGGAMKLKRERKRTGEVKYKSRLISFRNGLETLPKSLLSAARARLVLRAQITDLQEKNDGWVVKWTEGRDASEHEDTFDHVIITVPATALKEIPFENPLRDEVSMLTEIPHPALSTLVLGFKREAVEHPLDGFGVLIPGVENRRILGSIFSSTLFPGRAPEGHVSLMNFIGGVTQPDMAVKKTDEMTEIAIEELNSLMGINGEPVLVRHHFWPEAIPQYNVGHGVYLDRIASIEKSHPRLTLQGNYRGGPGLSDCLVNGFAAGKRIADTVDTES